MDRPTPVTTKDLTVREMTIPPVSGGGQPLSANNFSFLRKLPASFQ
jgi:hypothetical protein